MCDDKAVSLERFLAFVAVVVSLYDVEPAGGKAKSFVGISKGVASSWPVLPVKVWIKRREIAKAK